MKTARDAIEQSLTLHQAASFLSGAVSYIGADVPLRRIVVDSRQVAPGDVFVAIRGVARDAHEFVPAAFRAGAAAAVVEDAAALPDCCTGIVVPNGRRALAELHAASRGFPSHQIALVGVTGTDGKTTTASLIAAVFNAARLRTGLITTVSAQIGGIDYDTGPHTTTPDSPDIQRLLAEMVAAGCTHAVLETTSHAIAQERVHACDYDVAVVTNVTPEHLDYHRTFEEYRQTKRRLFTGLAASYRKPGVPKVAVVNADDPACADFASVAADRVIRYGIEHDADVRAERVETTVEGVYFEAVTPGWRRTITLRLPGRYNVANALAAIGVAVGLGIDPEAIVRAFESFGGVDGRMEAIDGGQPFSVVVDFAHTPNSLRAALTAVRGFTKGKVTVVFGCAGLRYQQKRPMMGEVAGLLADRIVLTAEDPRTEDVHGIMAAIATGLKRVGREAERDYWTIADRDEAIAFALRHAQPGDVVLVAGKGHERTMCYGAEERPWSDQEAVRRHLKEMGWPRSRQI